MSSSAHYVIEKLVDIGELERAGDRERLFTERLSRQIEMLRRFRRASDKPNVSQLAEEFRVDRKTIRRDLHDLVVRGRLPEAMRNSAAA